MKRLAVALIIAIFCLAAGIVIAQPLVSPTTKGCDALTSPFLLAQSDYGGEFDLNYCQWECRMRYGLEPTGSGAGGGGLQSDQEDINREGELQQSSATYNQYAGCIANCTKKFWQEFDRKTRGRVTP